MLHTSNFMGSGMTSSPVAGQPVNTSEPNIAAGRPVARKSQIIEEEEDMDGIQEDDEETDGDGFVTDPGTPGDAVNPYDHLEDTTPRVSVDREAGSPSGGKTPLAPTPGLENSPLRPPRSSSLRSPTDIAEDKIGTAE